MPAKVKQRTKRGRPPKAKNAVKTVHFGLKVTEHALLMGVVASENVRLVKKGFEPMASTASIVRKLIKEEAQRRGLLDKPLPPIDTDVEAEARAERAAYVPLSTLAAQTVAPPGDTAISLEAAPAPASAPPAEANEHPVKRWRDRGGAGWPDVEPGGEKP